MRPYEVAEKRLRQELIKLGFEEESLEKAMGEMLRLGALLVDIAENECVEETGMHPQLAASQVLLLPEPKN